MTWTVGHIDRPVVSGLTSERHGQSDSSRQVRGREKE